MKIKGKTIEEIAQSIKPLSYNNLGQFMGGFEDIDTAEDPVDFSGNTSCINNTICSDNTKCKNNDTCKSNSYNCKSNGYCVKSDIVTNGGTMPDSFV